MQAEDRLNRYFCKLKPGQFCAERFCSRCYIWVKWDVVLREAMDNVNRIERENKGRDFEGPCPY